MHGRGSALLAIALPVLAGLAYLWLMGAPASFLAINMMAFGLAAILIVAGTPALQPQAGRFLAVVLIALLFLPLLTGPSPNGIARWLPLGPFMLHSGALFLPALVVLAARDEDFAPPMLLAALFAATLQPDAATGLAVTLAAVGLYNATGDWRLVLVAALSFFASIVAGLRGELPAQPFVERIIVGLTMDQPALALGLVLALLGGFFLMVFALRAERPVRLALAGSLFGFSLAAIVSNYPSVLIGYGAAPILGFGLALALATGAKQSPPGQPDS